jgi:hypothetical protein
MLQTRLKIDVFNLYYVIRIENPILYPFPTVLIVFFGGGCGCGCSSVDLPPLTAQPIKSATMVAFHALVEPDSHWLTATVHCLVTTTIPS